MAKSYRLCNGFKPGAYGAKHVVMLAFGNVLDDPMAQPFIDSGVIEVEPEPKPEPEPKQKPDKKPAKKKAAKSADKTKRPSRKQERS